MDDHANQRSNPGWKIATIILALLLAAAALGVWLTSQALLRVEQLPAPVEIVTESVDKQIVESLETEEEIVLVSAGVQGLIEESKSSEVFGFKVPGTGRTTFVEYKYRAKLGVDGAAVEIEQTGEKQFRVKVPPFVFIGHDDAEFRTAFEDNGVLSWTTPEIDTAEAITRVLDSEAKQKHINDNRDLLEEQTKNFYEGIVRAVDPEVQLTFDFSDDA